MNSDGRLSGRKHAREGSGGTSVGGNQDVVAVYDSSRVMASAVVPGLWVDTTWDGEVAAELKPPPAPRAVVVGIPVLSEMGTGADMEVEGGAETGGESSQGCAVPRGRGLSGYAQI